MDVIDLRMEKEKFEYSLSEFLSIKLSEFIKKTGLYIDGINISFMKVQEFASKDTRTICTRVDCEVDL